jgi:hypothetical protein
MERLTNENLLTYLNSDGKQYVESLVNSPDKECYRKLKNLVYNHTLEIGNFHDTLINLKRFSWKDSNKTTNWWFQIQTLPFLNWYICSYSLQNKKEKSRFLDYCEAVINNWVNKIAVVDSPLAWHDHAVALRLLNIVRWLVFCQTEAKHSVAKTTNPNVRTLVVDHLEWLCQEHNYSQHTNHGFVQSTAVLTVAMMFRHHHLEYYRSISEARLLDEIKFAFSNEGVHKENSANYQKYMLRYVNEARKLSELGERTVSVLAKKYIIKAETFLGVITRPDGYLPMIGDTKGGIRGLTTIETPFHGCKVYDYSNSGYVIAKGTTSTNESYYLLVKNCHDSNYHRHDDDLMIYLWLDGAVLLGDGGLYSYQKKNNDRREFVLSHRAHSVPFIEGRAIRDKNKLIKKPSLIFDSVANTIVGKSYSFGKEIVRIVDLSELSSGRISVTDESTSNPLFVNYFFGTMVAVSSLNRDGAILRCNGASCELNLENAKKIELFNGYKNDLSQSSFLSEKYEEYLENNRLLVTAEDYKVIWQLNFGTNKLRNSVQDIAFHDKPDIRNTKARSIRHYG